MGEREIRLETGSKRVRTYLDGHLVADTITPLLVWERPYAPTYYVPIADVAADLVPAGPGGEGVAPLDGVAGPATVFDVHVAGRVAPAAARRYPDAPIAALHDAIRLEWGAFDEWLEEDEPVYTHPRDPYHRVDILASSRHVVMAVDGVTVADSRRPVILFETRLPPRFYLPITDVRMDLLEPSTTLTHCPYKGAASYWSLLLDGVRHEDIAWMYRAPLPESQKIAGLLCFYNEAVDLILDGTHQPRPHTHFR